MAFDHLVRWAEGRLQELLAEQARCWSLDELVAMRPIRAQVGHDPVPRLAALERLEKKSSAEI